MIFHVGIAVIMIHLSCSISRGIMYNGATMGEFRRDMQHESIRMVLYP